MQLNSKVCARDSSDSGIASSAEAAGGAFVGFVVFLGLGLFAVKSWRRRKSQQIADKTIGGHTQAVDGPILVHIDPFTAQSPATQSRLKGGKSQPTPGVEQPATSYATPPTSAISHEERSGEDSGRERSEGSLPTNVASTLASHNRGPWNDTIGQLVNIMTEVREELRTIGNAVHRPEAPDYDEQPPEYIH